MGCVQCGESQGQRETPSASRKRRSARERNPTVSRQRASAGVSRCSKGAHLCREHLCRHLQVQSGGHTFASTSSDVPDAWDSQLLRLSTSCRGCPRASRRPLVLLVKLVPPRLEWLFMLPWLCERLRSLPGGGGGDCMARTLLLSTCATHSTALQAWHALCCSTCTSSTQGRRDGLLAHALLLCTPYWHYWHKPSCYACPTGTRSAVAPALLAHALLSCLPGA
jgi:hypothetical protein